MTPSPRSPSSFARSFISSYLKSIHPIAGLIAYKSWAETQDYGRLRFDSKAYACEVNPGFQTIWGKRPCRRVLGGLSATRGPFSPKPRDATLRGRAGSPVALPSPRSLMTSGRAFIFFSIQMQMAPAPAGCCCQLSSLPSPTSTVLLRRGEAVGTASGDGLLWALAQARSALRFSFLI